MLARRWGNMCGGKEQGYHMHADSRMQVTSALRIIWIHVTLPQLRLAISQCKGREFNVAQVLASIAHGQVRTSDDFPESQKITSQGEYN